MKKFFCTLGLSLSVISSALAGDSPLDLLNTEITNILTPFQNQTTAAKLKFDAVEINNERALKVALNGLYSKMGSKNNFIIKVDNLGYDYNDGISPTTTLKGSLGFDLTKFLSREQSNEMVPKSIELLEETVKSYTEEYGDAIFIKGVVTSTTKDAEGNYIGLSALLAIKIDLDKLPEYLSPEDVMVTDAFFSITLNLKTGIAIDSFIVSNPEYLGYQQDQMGLKEVLENLLARGDETKRMIETVFMSLDSIPSDIVEMDNSLFRNSISNNKKLSNILK